MGPEADEQQLIALLKQGNMGAAGKLMDIHGEAFMRYLYSIAGTREAAEDIFQDSWVRVMEKIRLFDAELSFRPWLFRIGRNVAYDLLRKKRRWRFFGTDPLSESAIRVDIPDPADVGDQVVARETVQELMETLTPAHREVLYLRFFEDQTYEEIAELCRLPIGTVRSRLKRGLDYLAGHLRKEENHG